MKTITYQVIVTEGSDEFWESNPSKAELYELMIEALADAFINVEEVKIIRIDDITHYDKYSYQNDMDNLKKEEE